MAILVSKYLRYTSMVILIFAIFYKYEISSDKSVSDKKTLLLTKKAVLPYNRSFLYEIITNINKYTVVCYLNNKK